MTKALKKYFMAVTVLLCVFLSNAFAQSVVYSPDQWPKRWGRAMHHNTMMRGSVNRYRSINGNRSNGYSRTNSPERSKFNTGSQRQQGWGQQPEEKRYTRSKTPDYNYRSYSEEFNAAPSGLPYSFPGNSYYGVGSVYPPVYQGIYPAYPNILAPNLVTPGLGGLGFPYASPLLMPGLGYPGVLPGVPGYIGGYPGSFGYPW